MKRQMDSETTQAPYSAQSSSSANWTVDIWRDLYLAPGRAALAVGFSLAAVVTLVVEATDMPVTFVGLLRLFVILGLGLSVFWFWAFYTGAVQRFERRTGIDYNHDGKIGDMPVQPTAPAIIKTKLYNESGQMYGEDRQPIDSLTNLERLALGWRDNRPLNQTEWEPVMGRAEFNKLRDQLIEGGFAEWVSAREPKHGWKLTRRGERLFDSVADRAKG